MIYLVGGPPRCGKTKLAEALAKRKSIPYFSIDHLGSVISPYIPSGEQDRAFPLAAARTNAGGSNDIFHANRPPAEIVDLYLRQAETYWRGVENFVRYGLRDEHDFILEGWQLLPRLVNTLAANQCDGLAVLFMYKKDVNEIVRGLRAGRNDWVVRRTRYAQTFACAQSWG